MCNLRRAERCAYGKAAPENRIIRSVTRKVTDKVTEKVTDNLDEKLLVSRKTAVSYTHLDVYKRQPVYYELENIKGNRDYRVQKEVIK